MGPAARRAKRPTPLNQQPVDSLQNVKHCANLSVMVSEVLRAAVSESAETRYRIAQETGIKESTLSRFVRGGGLNLRSVDLLAAHLGLRLTPVKQRRSPLRKG